MKRIYFVVTLAVSAFWACNGGSHETETKVDSTSAHNEHTANCEHAHWAYEGEEGPANWATICETYSSCNGKHQSPIDITTAMVSDSLKDLAFAYTDTKNCSFINNGHTVQVNFSDSSTNSITLAGVVYTLKQFHFHCPSEHTISGKAFPCEAHMVHKSDDGKIRA